MSMCSMSHILHDLLFGCLTLRPLVIVFTVFLVWVRDFMVLLFSACRSIHELRLVREGWLVFVFMCFLYQVLFVICENLCSWIENLIVHVHEFWVLIAGIA